MKEIIIGDKQISEESPVFFIAEIGINHNGELDLAKKMIDMAVYCNADAVKFQKRTLDLCIPPEMRNRIKETPWGEMTYYEYKERLEFGESEYREIDQYCQEKKILWSASAWDIPSLTFLEKMGVPYHKIPSAQLTNRELLLSAKETNKPIFLSTGMSTEEEIKRAIEILKDTPLIIMHSNSAYPSVNGDLNLSYIPKLKELYPEHIVGYSGHEEGISASLVAATLGAKVIERHVTINRAMWGTDQAASIEFSGLRRIVRDLKKLPIWLGNGKKVVTPSELPVKKRLRNVETL
ncbi:MAG: N-acetylneuraminate synthase family protein [Promethearchaeota archaeon]